MSTLDDFVKQSSRRATGVIPLSEPVALQDLPTPALTIDLDAFDRNLNNMQQYLNTAGIGLRSHTKMHKCPVIAHKQLAAGAIGVCAATVSEAEVMQHGGIGPILITSPVATLDKLQRVVDLATTNSQLQIVVDDQRIASELNGLAGDSNITIGVLIDVDPLMGRTGIAPGEPALLLAQHILNDCPALRFDGLQMYAGSCMHVNTFDKRRARYYKSMTAGQETMALFEANAIDVPVFSGGGTGSYNMEHELDLITDLQAGSYVFMDIEYRDIGGIDSEQFNDFAVSLFVLVTAISQPQSRMITVDAGFKSFASDKMAPQFRDVEGTVFRWGGDEHGIIQLDNPSRTISLGDKLQMLTPHCDPTVNLYDYYYPYRDGVVEEIWPISARGCSQ
jgi:3-hydroxy-D-aspartate aldolase